MQVAPAAAASCFFFEKKKGFRLRFYIISRGGKSCESILPSLFFCSLCDGEPGGGVVLLGKRGGGVGGGRKRSEGRGLKRGRDGLLRRRRRQRLKESIEIALTLTSSSALSSVSAVTEVHKSVFEPLATTTSASRGRANGGRGGGDEEACGCDGADDVAAGADDEGCCSAIATIRPRFRAFREAHSVDDATELPASRERGDAEAGEDTSLPRLDLSAEDVDAAATETASEVEQPRPLLLLLEPAAAASEHRACIVWCEKGRRDVPEGARRIGRCLALRAPSKGRGSRNVGKTRPSEQHSTHSSQLVFFLSLSLWRKASLFCLSIFFAPRLFVSRRVLCVDRHASDARLHVEQRRKFNGARRQLQRPHRNGDVASASPRRASSKAAAGNAFVAECGPFGSHSRAPSGYMQG